MNRLDVETSRLQPMMAVLLGVIMVPLGLASLVGGVMRGFAIVPVAIGAMVLAMFGLVVGLVRRGGGKSVRYFTDEGLERGDGRFLPWTELAHGDLVQERRVRLASFAQGPQFPRGRPARPQPSVRARGKGRLIDCVTARSAHRLAS